MRTGSVAARRWRALRPEPQGSVHRSGWSVCFRVEITYRVAVEIGDAVGDGHGTPGARISGSPRSFRRGIPSRSTGSRASSDRADRPRPSASSPGSCAIPGRPPATSSWGCPSSTARWLSNSLWRTQCVHALKKRTGCVYSTQQAHQVRMSIGTGFSVKPASRSLDHGRRVRRKTRLGGADRRVREHADRYRYRSFRIGFRPHGHSPFGGAQLHAGHVVPAHLPLFLRQALVPLAGRHGLPRWQSFP